MKRREFMWLGVIVLCAVAARLAYLYSEIHAAGFQWEDPDGYLRQAAALTQSGGWRWTRQAVEYVWGGRTWVLPPGYPLFLSIFYGAHSPDPTTAAVAQCVIGGLSTAMVFVIARSLHSVRAGFIAAIVWAMWFPAISGSRAFVQEQLYVPLLCASFAALAWALAKPATSLGFLLTGIVFALTALTRAMPLFFMPFLLALIWWSERRRQRGMQATMAFLAGVALLVLPYTVWLSFTAGRVVMVDDHMMILQTSSRDPRSIAAVVSLLAKSVTEQFSDNVHVALGMFKVYGPSWLYHYGSVASERTAWAFSLFVHVGLDTLFVAAVLAAPIGLALARERHVSAALLMWAAFVVVSSVLVGFVGPRYRAPFEPMLVAAAAVAAGGGYRWPPRLVGLVAATASLALAVYVLPQYVDSWQASVPYGLNGWTRVSSSGVQQTFARETAGFYVPAVNGMITVDIEPFPESGPIEIAVKVERVQVTTVHVPAGRPTSVTLPAGQRGVAFVELVPRDRNPSSAYYLRILR